MRRFIFLLILFASLSMICQTHKISPDVAYWEPSDFPKGILKAEAYEFKVKNGKIKKDSLLIGSANLVNNSVEGINFSLQCITHTGCERKFQEYKRIYSPSGKLLHSKYEPVDKNLKKDKYSLDYDYNASESSYKYDQIGNKIEEKNLFKHYNFSLDRKTKDTILISLVIQPTIFSYLYKGTDLVSHYTQKDSVISRNVFLDSDTTEVSASYHYEPKSKNVEYLYNKSGQLSYWISYTREGKFHTKKYYFYDDKSRIVKEIDSTGWYFTPMRPYILSLTTYNYTTAGLIKTVEEYENQFNSGLKTITHYDSKGFILRECRQSEAEAAICDRNQYFYDGEKVVKITHSSKHWFATDTYFKYNSEGLLVEEKVIINDKIINLVRYYYK